MGYDLLEERGVFIYNVNGAADLTLPQSARLEGRNHSV